VGPARKTHRPALLLGIIIPFQSEQEQKGQQVLRNSGHTKTLVESMASQNIVLEVAIGPPRLTANAIAERQKLISMSARGRLPTSNTFELIKAG
jgi:hypothetical protein